MPPPSSSPSSDQSSGPSRGPSLRVTDPSSLLASVPYLLGFVARRSLVVVVTDADSARVSLTMRVDLLSDRAPASVQAAHTRSVVEPVRRLGPSRVYLVAYPEPPPQWWVRLLGPAALRVTAEAFEQAGVPVGDTLVVGRGRWWSARCDDPACCPLQGRPLETSAAWATRAELVAAGLAPRRSREQVVASVAPRGGQRARAVARAWATVLAESAPPSVACAAEATLSLLLVAGATSGAAAPEMAAALVALGRPPVRDIVLGTLGSVADVEVVRGAVAGLVDLTRWAPPGAVAPPAACVCALAYLSGDGALAWAAHDRALDDDPDSRLATLMGRAMRIGLPPTELRAALVAALPSAPRDEHPTM